MAKKEIIKNEEEQLVGEAISKGGQWIIDHQNLLSYCVLGIVAVIACGILLHNYVFKPKAEEAKNANAKAVAYLMAGDFEKALNGDDADCIGFEEIANDYSLYQPGKLAALYAGICYYQLGEMEEAAKYVKKFSASDLTIDPASSQFLGDIYVELEEYGKAASAFKAAAESGNSLIAPMSLKKLGFVYLEQGKNKDAKKAFEAIKADYPTSAEAQDIEKYIEIAK